MRVVDIRIVKKEVAEGEFDCPICGDVRPYRHLRAGRLACLFGASLLPLGRPVHHLECQGCEATFEDWILELTDEERCSVAAVHERGMLYVLAATALAGGPAVEVERERVLDVFAALSGAQLPGDQLDAALEAMAGRRGRIWRYLRGLEFRLNDAGKEQVVHAALFLAANDGRLDRRGVRHVRNVARSVGMERARLTEVVAAAGRRAESPLPGARRWGRWADALLRGRGGSAPEGRGATTLHDGQAPLLR